MGGKAYNGRRVRRDEVEGLTQSFLMYVGLTHIPYKICGSFRRGKPECGDIEIVFTAHPDVRPAIAQIFGTTQDYNPVMHGIWQGVQFDLFIASEDEWGAMILHATGSGAFNMMMRARAKARGYKLNQYGLWEGDRRVIGGESEMEYFAGLGVRYHSPEERNI